MNWFKNLKITAKLALSFGVLLAIMAVLGGVAVMRLNAVAAKSHEIARNWLPSIEYLSEMNTAKSDLRVEQLRYAMATTSEELTQFEKSMQGAIADLEEKKKLYIPLITDGAEKATWDEFDRQWQAYIAFSNKLTAVGRQGKQKESWQMMVDSRDTYVALGTALRKDVDVNVAGAGDEAKNAEELYSTSRTIVIGLILISIVFGVLMALAVGRSIGQPLSGIIEIFKRIAAGKLDNTIEANRRDELGVLLMNLDEMQSQMRKLLAESQGQLAAINRAQAVIEFDLKGTIQSANDNFLTVMGYRLEEIKGQHHSMFIDAAYRSSDDYRRFWEKLGRGDYETAQYKRIGKGGKEVWIQGSYNPILDTNGKPYKVIKYASDVTAQVKLSQQMEESVAQTQQIIKGATDGDLAKRLDVRGKSGDLAKLAEAINSLLESVADIVSNVKHSAGEVLRGAEEISQGNANLSQRTEEQSSSLEETASSMEEMTSTVKQNADNAGQANQLATAARDQAEKGGAVVGNAVKAMADINDSSKKISDIISVIDEIAFQTNLLALNAAVEAARAGEQGRGFAVVATEVRSLAGRSATAAKEIKELIQDSVRKVEDGSLLVTQSGQTLEQIVLSVKKVSDIVAEIAAASREQSSGIEQVNKAVMQMDEMTQQNAALVEQATAASQSMADQARDLSKMMDRYQVGEAAAAARTSRPEPVQAARPERRAAGRPFSGKPRVAAKSTTAEPSEAPATRRKAAANGGDADWREF
ncbi:MAG: methyl-accepting chemotaxis protein [Steroidobacteraceae bacterium]